MRRRTHVGPVAPNPASELATQVLKAVPAGERFDQSLLVPTGQTPKSFPTSVIERYAMAKTELLMPRRSTARHWQSH